MSVQEPENITWALTIYMLPLDMYAKYWKKTTTTKNHENYIYIHVRAGIDRYEIDKKKNDLLHTLPQK